MTCAFFGHRTAPETLIPFLEKEIRRLIEQEGCDEFLVGNQGRFDSMAYSAVKRIQKMYPSVRCCVVLAYMPGEKDRDSTIDYSDTLYPDGIENVPTRFAISARNRWMVENADAVICYIHHTFGGAYQAVALAQKKKIKTVNLFQE